MPHFAEENWADYVRGVTGPDVAVKMQAHLTAACADCQTVSDRWSQIRRIAAAEEKFIPPDGLVRMAKLAFAAKYPTKSIKSTLAKLVFNGFAQPLQAGVRSGALNVWQVVYEAEGMTVDLRFGHRAHSREVHLVGQVLDKRDTRIWQNDATVELSDQQDQVVATTALTNLGEFHFEFEQISPMWLSIKAAGRNTVRIPLNSPK